MAVAKERLPLWGFGPSSLKVRNRDKADEKKKKAIENETRKCGSQNPLSASRPHLRQRVDGENQAAEVEEKADHGDNEGASL